MKKNIQKLYTIREIEQTATVWYDRQPAELKALWLLNHPKWGSESISQYISRLYNNRNDLDYLIP